jgi:hypothetical protein
MGLSQEWWFGLHECKEDLGPVKMHSVTLADSTKYGASAFKIFASLNRHDQAYSWL